MELASEPAAFAGKLLGDLGAAVTLVEPPGGAPTRGYPPFVDDEPGPERSLWWWHYQTGKRSVVLDLDRPDGRDRLRALAAAADLVLEAEPPGRLARLGVDHPDLRACDPALVWVSVTPFGRADPRSSEPVTDLTLLAGGGPVWSCGYDDHTLPPVRGGGNQGFQTAALHAAVASLVALLHRDATGAGQHVDVSMHAAANVTTEAATYSWLVARETVQRQTCRHAAVRPTAATTVHDPDGRFVPTGVPPRSAPEFRALLDWLDDLGWREDLPEAVFLELGVERGGVSLADLATDVEAQAVFGAARDALVFIASRIPASEFFLQGQRHGLALPVVNAAEDVMADPHFVARGFPVMVEHPELGRAVAYPGAPFLMERSPWRLAGRAPHLGEHTTAVLAEVAPNRGAPAGRPGPERAAPDHADVLLDVGRLRAWLDDRGIGTGCDLTVERLSSGKSNEMFVLTRGAERFVLRRPAAVALEGADDGMRREHRILTALEGTAVPHAKPLARCDDRSVVGSVFSVMAYVDGFLPVEPLPAAFTSPAAHRELALAMVDALAELHLVDWRSRLADLGRPDGFHERQRARWLGQYERYPAQELPGVEALGEWLDAHRPAEWTPTLMHGDYHVANVLVAPDRPARVAAICDWETATIGDPLLDLAGFLRFWFEMHGGPGWPRREELVARYEARTGTTVPDLAYYDVLARFRLAILVEGIYQRSQRDATRVVAHDLHDYALVLVASAGDVVGRPGA